MKVLRVRNVHEALPQALALLRAEGYQEDSRNGPVLRLDQPVTTVYDHPRERVVFYEERDYNIAFVLYEALWMLQGRDDLAPLLRYVSTFGQFSDNGVTLHGAYGMRWREHFPLSNEGEGGVDQIETIVETLRVNPNDRRCVLQMWDPTTDLGIGGKDVPCNLTITFQINKGKLDMVLFCRSNDVLWGAYFANAFHMSVLQEYIAAKIGTVGVGTYSQVSVNWHGYLATIGKLDLSGYQNDPYWTKVTPMPAINPDYFDNELPVLMAYVDGGCSGYSPRLHDQFLQTSLAVLRAHKIYKDGDQGKASKFKTARSALDTAPAQDCDAVKSMNQWLNRREHKKS